MNIHDRALRVSAMLLVALVVAGCSSNDANAPSSQKTSDGSKPVAQSSDPAGSPSPYTGADPIYLKQGWIDDERLDFYFVSQGSELLPYVWFLNLEPPDSDEPFRSDSHLASLGYIPHSSTGTRNRDGLPIGFTENDNPATIDVKLAFLGPGYDTANYPRTNKWLGLTCAACHTADLTYKGKVIRIDGGPAMADHQTFLSKLAAALRATATDDRKFGRFERKLSEGGNNDTTTLKAELESYATVIETLVKRNESEHPYGFARLDAFGAILNQICEAALGIPQNRGKSSAPVSYPFLWDAPRLDWVQWNSAAAVPILRNVGEVLGVYAHLKLTGTPAEGQFLSSARVDKLDRLEDNLTRLKAPEWPEDIFGAIDRPKAEAGKKLFVENCAKCHGVRGADDEFPLTTPNQFGKTFIKTHAIAVKEIRTDPTMVENFATRKALPGALAPLIEARLQKLKQEAEAAGLPVPDFSEGAPAALLLNAAVRAVMQKSLATDFPNITDEMKARLNGFRDADATPPLRGGGYKARPLNGIWATAPYLHSGAVPSLYQLLLPEDQRVKSFYVGSREFDPRHVGFRTDKTEGAFAFRTETDDGQPIPGNSNKGHSGHGYTQWKRDGVTDSDFTDEERWALVEYMKTLK